MRTKAITFTIITALMGGEFAACKTYTDMTHTQDSIIPYDTLAAEDHAYFDDGGVSLFRVISPDDWVYDYRITDYNGGFYIFLQTIHATAREIKKQVPFDELKARPRNRVLHYIRTDQPDFSEDNSNTVSFVIPNYYVESIILADGVGFDAFDPMSKENQWEQYGGMFGSSSLPWYDLPHTRLNLHAAAKADASGRREAWFERKIAESREVANAGETTMHDNMSIVEELRRRGEYDTIVHTEDGRNIYYNVDLESYEQSAAPDDFYIIYRKFHPNGRLREFRRFLPGVYGQLLPVGYWSVYDERGTVTSGNMANNFYSPGSADPEFCAELLAREGFIDLESGNGKAVMEINTHIDPHAPSHGVPRLSIRAPWGMQVDDSLNGTVGLLATRDGVETVYIINKNSHTIYQKFTRQ